MQKPEPAGSAGAVWDRRVPSSGVCGELMEQRREPQLPSRWGKQGTVSPSLHAPAIPAPRGQQCRHGDAGAVEMNSPSWEMACTEGAGGNTVVTIYLSINDMT